MTDLTRRLGYDDDTRLMILSASGLGACHAANIGVYEALRQGIATSASLMMPCPWSREAHRDFRGEDVGVSLTLAAEYDLYRWGPLTLAPSLLDGDGGFPRTAEDLWDHADLEEVRRECRAQIERAVLWGFDVTHLDVHRGTLNSRPEFFDVLLDMAVEFRLPLCLGDHTAEKKAGFPLRRLATDGGVLIPDHVVPLTDHASSRRSIDRAVHDLQPGVTLIMVQPASDTPELRALAPNWADLVDDHHLVTHDHGLRSMLDRAGATLIGWRPLRDLQRAR